MLKKIMLVLLFSVFFLYGLAVGHYNVFPFHQIVAAKHFISGPEPEISFVATPYYLHKKTFFQLNSQDDYNIVFIGDSITDESDWYDIFPDQIIANRGISGDSTEGVLKRMDTITNTKAEKAFIMIGTNDIASDVDVETIIENYEKILDELEINKITPIVQSTLLTYNKTAERNENINKLNTKLKSVCLKRNITYVDLNPYLSENGMLSEKYSYDGLHLNGEGYAMWSKVILEYVN
ncbi:G-D-S-L family lipolytic protein [Psychrobacter sp. 28M-43]|uniref:GDSL-type esterase/lipase family protein n=1 Tax=Psychrobacter sp. 28M-43 TaxID=2772254 RepID=UPI00168D302E|nr:GDSL-type esterase/lipase family protein [Psychrobacter sp. 28M-43]QOD13543.1 G-D-S-L family lipolytic protein [Psychrobacter sp. 28M-43]